MNPVDIVLVAHNMRSLWNIGSLFRTSDAFDVSSIWLTGYTATPPRREIAKTALGADEWIPWHKADIDSCLRTLKADGYRIVGLELDDRSVEVSSYVPHEKTALLLGHEVTGIPDDQINLCDDVICIPMHGKKQSLNVSVATGIALHQLRVAESGR